MGYKPHLFCFRGLIRTSAVLATPNEEAPHRVDAGHGHVVRERRGEGSGC